MQAVFVAGAEVEHERPAEEGGEHQHGHEKARGRVGFDIAKHDGSLVEGWY
jgi:hypothetical protein